ncbi:hypothetical Protein YC6258_04828 [Gynuella sunshinyii YC6258]|uniref:Uncharacterized protein n=1 Tax=Gynuella sunshinyii YC6258 TaxID=1445510 RepID=A0A0C5VRJ5_9GAMM|nr:hypothetical Protein YC6258_04828 [Gynuella sunshinyii YC6258]
MQKNGHMTQFVFVVHIWLQYLNSYYIYIHHQNECIHFLAGYRQ